MLDATVLWKLCLSRPMTEITVIEFCSQAYTGSDWKSKQGDSAMVRRDPSMVHWITKWWDIQGGYKPAFSSLDSEVFELGELRDERRSPVKGIGKGIKEAGLCKMCPKALLSLGSSLGKLRCNINLKQCLCPLTCFWF